LLLLENALGFPLSPQIKGCDFMACYCFGLPLAAAKADFIHSLQGVAIGDSKAIKRILLHWFQPAESL
jgi:hypothetical protein